MAIPSESPEPSRTHQRVAVPTHRSHLSVRRRETRRPRSSSHRNSSSSHVDHSRRRDEPSRPQPSCSHRSSPYWNLYRSKTLMERTSCWREGSVDGRLRSEGRKGVGRLRVRREGICIGDLKTREARRRTSSRRRGRCVQRHRVVGGRKKPSFRVWREGRRRDRGEGSVGGRESPFRGRRRFELNFGFRFRSGGKTALWLELPEHGREIEKDERALESRRASRARKKRERRPSEGRKSSSLLLVLTFSSLRSHSQRIFPFLCD